MYEIFLKLITKKGLRPIDVSKATGIPTSAFSDWKSGKSKPGPVRLTKIANFLNVTVDYLINGKEPEQPNYIFTLNGLTGEEHAELIETYSMLSKENKECIMHIMKQLANKEG